MLTIILGILVFALGAGGQCVPRGETYNMPATDPVTLTEEIKPENLIRGFFMLFTIIRKEMFYTVNSSVSLTSSGDPGCSLLAEGIALDKLQNFPSDWGIPLMTNIRLFGSRFYIPDNSSHTLVTPSQFLGLIEILGLKSEVQMTGHPRVVAHLSRKVLTNFDRMEANTCEMDKLSINLRLRLQQQLAAVEKVWKKFRAVLSFYGQQKRFDNLDQCAGSTNLSVKELISLPVAVFDTCINKIMISAPTSGSSDTRKPRNINLLSTLLGEGDEIIKIENTISGAISTFNADFKRVENFSHQVKSSLQTLDAELFTLLASEEKIKSHMIDLEMELVTTKNRLEYIVVKLQHIGSINQMLTETRLPETLEDLERGALHRNICKLDTCETGIHTTIKNDTIYLHRTLVQLIPVQRYLVECKAISSFKISQYHNLVATRTDMGNFLINTTLVNESDLSNETVVNSELRTLKVAELHLGVFNVFGRNLQCMKKMEFSLNGELLSCNPLEVFVLPPEYIVAYGKRELSEHKIERNGQKKVLQTWMGSYSFDNMLREGDLDNDDVVTLLHPYLDDFLFDESANIDIASLSVISGGTILLGACFTMLCCCCCQPYRQCTVSLCTWLGGIIYRGCTTKKYRINKQEEAQTRELDKENQELRKDNERSRITLENTLRENEVVNEALRILGMNEGTMDPVNASNVLDKSTESGEIKDGVKRKCDERRAQPHRKFVTFSSANNRAVAHLGDGMGEKGKDKQ